MAWVNDRQWLQQRTLDLDPVHFRRTSEATGNEGSGIALAGGAPEVSIRYHGSFRAPRGWVLFDIILPSEIIICLENLLLSELRDSSDLFVQRLTSWCFPAAHNVLLELSHDKTQDRSARG